MNWSQCRIALGYDCHMMNIIQQITDPMPTNLSYIVSAKFYCYRYCCTCYKITAITVIVAIAIDIATTIKTIILLCY